MQAFPKPLPHLPHLALLQRNEEPTLGFLSKCSTCLLVMMWQTASHIPRFFLRQQKRLACLPVGALVSVVQLPSEASQINDALRSQVFEDSPAGVQAAAAAGMCCVAVPDARIVKRVDEDCDSAAAMTNDGQASIFSSASRPIADPGLREGYSPATTIVESLEGLVSDPNPSSVDGAQASLAAGGLGARFLFSGAS